MILDAPLSAFTHHDREDHFGGKIKASDVLGGISGIAAGASAIPFLAPFTAPIAALTGVAGGIARLFGGALPPIDEPFNPKLPIQKNERIPHRLLNTARGRRGVIVN